MVLRAHSTWTEYLNEKMAVNQIPNTVKYKVRQTRSPDLFSKTITITTENLSKSIIPVTVQNSWQY
jgi:hypothetical protein